MGENLPKPDDHSQSVTGSPEVAPILEWIRGAEAHLAALQTDHDRVRLISEQQASQLNHMQSRVAVLEARVADLERADTDIAVTVARMQAIDSGR